MPQWHGNLHKRKRSGGKRKAYRKKRAYEMGREPTETKLGEKRLKLQRCRGGNVKIKALAYDTVNVADPKTGKVQLVKIRSVIANPANRDYERRGILTKGAVVETELGLAKVTSRPGQHGMINAILLEKT
ncbi:TPA: 30S ribosomal protein S8e [Candidatus Bathyarchaeota archaeon]|nr:30S ribosomal protein S8e [Candidatus Bathyarchaeota archaeon]